ncbi:MAG TPA: prephenate dehydratase domain-containing protein, partial [Magnetospirillaceae bacterium]|nr:prephenate dehydratase domain-containing protein [Magnetospirillaceae bacterium]
MKLERLRAEIDRIDSRILSLLEERMEKAVLTRRLKPGTRDAAREAEILARVASRSLCLSRPDFTAGLYRAILTESRALQDAEPRLVGFQGTHGAYSEAAVRAWDQEAAAIPFSEFSQVFDGVLDGSLDFGVVPVENTLGGIVGQVNSILVTTELRVVAAVDLPVNHCLLVVPGQDHREIRTVYSHPQALAQ